MQQKQEKVAVVNKLPNRIKNLGIDHLVTYTMYKGIDPDDKVNKWMILKVEVVSGEAKITKLSECLNRGEAIEKLTNRLRAYHLFDREA